MNGFFMDGSVMNSSIMNNYMMSYGYGAICPMKFWFWSYYLDKLLLISFALIALRLLYELFIGYYYSRLKLKAFVFGGAILLTIVSGMLYMPLLGLILSIGVVLPAMLGAMILRKIDNYYSKYYLSELKESNNQESARDKRYYKNWIVFGLICGVSIVNHLTIELKILSMILYFLFTGFIYLFGQRIINSAKKKYIHESLSTEGSLWYSLSGILFVLFVFSILAWLMNVHCGCYKLNPSMSYESVVYRVLK